MINQKIVAYSLSAILIAIGIVYFVVASSEYQDFKELNDMGITGESAEKQFEMTFFTATAIVNLILGVWILRARNGGVTPYVISGVISFGLIMIYVASRTVGVPVVGVEYYVGRIDVISKILQIIAIALSGIAIYNIRKLKMVKEFAM
jgi:hypothetical protein